MFVGHLAVALGAKSAEPRVPLGAAVAAAFGLDLLWPVLLLAPRHDRPMGFGGPRRSQRVPLDQPTLVSAASQLDCRRIGLLCPVAVAAVGPVD